MKFRANPDRLGNPRPTALRKDTHLLLPRLLAVGLASLVGLLPTQAAPYPLRSKSVDAAPDGDLTNSSGIRAWDAALAKETSGLQSPKLLFSRVHGLLQSGPARFPVTFPNPGTDLDLGYNDFLDLDLLLPAGFAGTVAVEYTTKGVDEDEPMERIVLPLAPLAADGHHRRVRLDLGLVPLWRGFLFRAALVIEPDASSRGKPVAVGTLLVGDAPGDAPARYEELNLKPEMKVANLSFMESKHGCIWWTLEHEQEGFDTKVMPRRALRMIEETWQVSVNLLSYRDPCLGVDPATKKHFKINHTTWYDGFWMGSDKNFPYYNVSEGGLRDEGYGNPVPHEFVHCVQAGQINFLRGCHWESHANYVRFHRNLHFKEIIGIDPMPFSTLLHASYFQDHPRLIYSDYRPYFYLDCDPDNLGLEPGLTAKLWQTGKANELFWDRLPTVLPTGVTRETVAAGIARSWLTFDFVGGAEQREAYFPEGPEGELRRFRFITPLVAVPDRPGTWSVAPGRAPMKFGWCVHDLVPSGGKIQAKLEGIDLLGQGESWRWGFVAFRKDGSYLASPIFEPGVGVFNPPTDLVRLALFVVATPADASLSYPRLTPDFAADRHPEHRRYPYEILLNGAVPVVRELKLEKVPGAKHPNGGGFVASSAEVESSAYVGPRARVLGSAKVRGNSKILDDAIVTGSATIEDDAIVSGGACVGEGAQVGGKARIRGFAFVGGQAKVRERARVGDFTDLQMGSDIHGDATVRGMAQPLDRGKVGGYTILDADYSMSFNLTDGVHYHHVPWGGWYFDEFAAKLTKPRGLVASYTFDESDGGQALDEFGSLHALLRGTPAREDGKLTLNGKDQSVLLDASIIDAPAATWILDASVTGRGTQPLFAVNDWNEDGLMVGVGESGRLAVILKHPGQAPLTLTSRTTVARGGEIRIALRLNGEKAALFHNGSKVAEQSWRFPPSTLFRDLVAESPAAVYLGRDGKKAYMSGHLDRFRAYNVALNDEEILKQP